MTTERLTAADGPQGDAWATGPVGGIPETAPRETAYGRRLRQERGQDLTGRAMALIAEGVNDLDRGLPGSTEALTDDLDYGALAETVAWLQAMKARLSQAEAFVARELGRMDSTPEVIELPDGRTALVRKGKERKEWRHDDWKRDVRLAVVRAAEIDVEHDLVDAETGQFIDVLDLIAKAQAVHGSAAPKVTALKPLGLSADDYCTSGPGPYSVQISAPEASTTTQEN